LYAQRRSLFSREPAIISAVGFSGHGKTVYLAALLHTLEKQLTRVWPDFYRQGLDVDSVQTVQRNLALLREGNLPESTRRNFPRPSVHMLAKMPHFGTRDVLIYDPPGEAFNTDEGIERYAHFVQRARVVLFLVSLIDLQPPEADDLYRLLQTYVLGLTRLKGHSRQQHLIVVYTKADQIIERLHSFPVVLTHLRDSDHTPLRHPQDYLTRLQAVSTELARFTAESLEAQNFINLARDQFKSVAYCAVSALGRAPENGHLAVNIEPRRAADPLFLVLQKS
jgi:hypothetical protein